MFHIMEWWARSWNVACWEVSWKGMRASLMEWNLRTCHRVEYSEVSLNLMLGEILNGMFDGLIELNVETFTLGQNISYRYVLVSKRIIEQSHVNPVWPTITQNARKTLSTDDPLLQGRS